MHCIPDDVTARRVQGNRRSDRQVVNGVGVSGSLWRGWSVGQLVEGLGCRAVCGGVGVSVPGGAVSWTPLVTAADVLNGDSEGQVSVC